MKNQLTKKNDYQIRNDQNFIIENKNIKTTNINVLLNRVRLEKKKKIKKNNHLFSFNYLYAKFYKHNII
jgi:hypothetical protein